MGKGWNIVFDCDGTLVDSAPGILAGMEQALAQRGIIPRVPLTADIIGPPLTKTLELVSGVEVPADLAELAAEFKRVYDQQGYRDTLPYAGIDAALRELAESGMRLHIATNKRGRPTRLILDHLGWTPMFESVYCLDEHPDCADKGTLLGRLLSDQAIESSCTLYVGDTEGDALAAKSNALPFLYAAWGYGSGAVARATPHHCDRGERLSVAIRQLFAQGHACPAN